MVAILGVLKAGAAYLPWVNPDDPADRLAFMLDDAQAACLVTTSTAADRLPTVGELNRLVLDDTATTEELAIQPDHDVGDADRASPLLWDHPVYVVYPSSSTGRPRGGVVVTHRGGGQLPVVDTAGRCR